MKKEANNQKDTDQIIRDIFKDFEYEQAPPSIKSSAMNKVFNEWTNNAINYKPIINKSNRWWILGTFSAMLALSFLVDASVIINYWQNLMADSDFVDFQLLNQQMGSISLAFKSMPSVVYFTCIGIAALLLIDRFFSRLANI